MEWDTLARQQQTVLTLVRDEYAKKLASCQANSLACSELKTHQAMHLMKLINQQQQERQQLRSHHRQEEADLAQLTAP